MNNINVTILYRDGSKENCYVADYVVENNCLRLYERYKKTRYIPLDVIKEWQVID